MGEIQVESSGTSRVLNAVMGEECFYVIIVLDKI